MSITSTPNTSSLPTEKSYKIQPIYFTFRLRGGSGGQLGLGVKWPPGCGGGALQLDGLGVVSGHPVPGQGH